MRIVIVGGSGHIGTYLVPRLVRAGHDVVVVSRGVSSAYAPAPEWKQVRRVTADRQAEDRDGSFAKRVLDLAPDAVVDLVCFTLDSARALVDGIRHDVDHLVHCGSIWRYGPALSLPVREGAGTPAIDEYGRQKQAIAEFLKTETSSGGMATTSLHPGQICGPGWEPIGPLGNRDPSVWKNLSAGLPVRMPGTGTELLSHVHADDVAQAFELALAHRDAAAGEDFSVVAASALSVRGYAQAVAGWFGHDAVLEQVGWDGYRETTSPEFAEASWGHLHRSQHLSIDKARERLGYTPRYEPEAAILQSVRRLIDEGRLDVAAPLRGDVATGRSHRA